MRNQAVFTSIDLNKYHYLDTIHKMVISHRGRKTGERENSIAAFEKAFAMGAQGIECDARLLPNGEVIISHDKIYKFDEQDFLLPELFSFIKEKKVPFFIELKDNSPILVEKLSEAVKKENLWDLVHLIGFSVMIQSALKAQKNYPKLKVIPFLNLPILSLIKMPKKSYGVFLGWIDEWKWSQAAFQKMISQKRLNKLKRVYEKNGFKVMAGVINNEKGLRYFKEAGITDIVTDEIELASKILKS
ncbi:MAG: glycerophosphodiester phosphodiesterase [Patescibacteria group bacterium]